MIPYWQRPCLNQSNNSEPQEQSDNDCLDLSELNLKYNFDQSESDLDLERFSMASLQRNRRIFKMKWHLLKQGTRRQLFLFSTNQKSDGF